MSLQFTRDFWERQSQLKRKMTALRRGRRAVPIFPDQLLHILRQATEGLPPDVELDSIEIDRANGQIVILVNSTHWQAGILSTHIPWLQLTIKGPAS